MDNELINLGYHLSKEGSVWKKPEYGGIPYSDGDDLENEILSAITSCQDVSLRSDELRSHCIGWVKTYHLSRSRANILRPFEGELRNKRVLEVGAGCGAITRYLGEIDCNVLALEGSVRRAQISRARTIGLKNVHVVCDNFQSFNTDERFDFITLIGVLEYASVFVDALDPAFAVLDKVRRLLKPDGKLILAIENKLGLKYFAGAPEDHTGIPMYGLESHYQKNEVRTFGLAELKRLVVRAGFKTCTVLLPFPDYKFPVSIVTQLGVRESMLDSAALIRHSLDNSFQLPYAPNFAVQRVWPVISENNLQEELSNSFLIVATKEDFRAEESNTLALHFNTERRAPFCKKTEFVKDEFGISVKSERVLGEDFLSGRPEKIQMLLPGKVDYVRGTPLIKLFTDILTSRRGWKDEAFAKLLKQYSDWICTKAQSEHSNIGAYPFDSELPPIFFDALPTNIIVKNDGEWEAIDLEWKPSEVLTFKWLVFRALLCILRDADQIQLAQGHFADTRADFVIASFKSLGIEMSQADLDDLWQREVSVQVAISGLAPENFSWRPDQYLIDDGLGAEFFRGASDERQLSEPNLNQRSQTALLNVIKMLSSQRQQLSLQVKQNDKEIQIAKEQIQILKSEIINTHKAWELRGAEIERREILEADLRRQVHDSKQRGLNLLSAMIGTVIQALSKCKRYTRRFLSAAGLCRR